MKKNKNQGFALICSLLVSIFCIGMVPNFAEASEELDGVPQFLEKNEYNHYGTAIFKYKNKTFLSSGIVIDSLGEHRNTEIQYDTRFNRDTTGYVKNTGKSISSIIRYDEVYDFEKETKMEIEPDLELKAELEKELKKKYNVSEEKRIFVWCESNSNWASWEIESYNEKLGYFTMEEKGVININTKEIMDGLDNHSSILYASGDDFVLVKDNNVIVRYIDGVKSIYNFDELENRRLRVFNKGNSIYEIKKYNYNDQCITVVIYEFDGKEYKKVIEVPMSSTYFDVDKNGQLWGVMSKGGKNYLSKYENRKFVPKYEINNEYDVAISVYDDNSAAVYEFDHNSKEGWYTIIDYTAVTSIALNKVELSLGKGQIDTLVATVNPSDAVNKNVKWTSSNTNVAKVDDNGKVTAVGIGNATITATTVEGGLTASAKVMVDFPTSDFKTHWGVDYIRNAMGNGWVIASDKFRPNDAITRAEFIKIVNRAFGYTEIGTEKFNDVYPNDWFYDEVRIAVKAGYITQNNTRFRPNDPISREEVAVIVTNIQKNKDTNYDKIKKYSDYKEISEWAKSSVEGVVEAGYMGVGVTSFYPLSNITRAEAVTTLIRVVEK